MLDPNDTAEFVVVVVVVVVFVWNLGCFEDLCVLRGEPAPMLQLSLFALLRDFAEVLLVSVVLGFDASDDATAAVLAEELLPLGDFLLPFATGTGATGLALMMAASRACFEFSGTERQK